MVKMHCESLGTAACNSAVTYLCFSPDLLSTVNGNGMKADQDKVWLVGFVNSILSALQGFCMQPCHSVFSFSASYPFTSLRS